MEKKIKNAENLYLKRYDLSLQDLQNGEFYYYLSLIFKLHEQENNCNWGCGFCYKK